jgi:hypothetical protein
LVAVVIILIVTNAQIRRESAERAVALEQKEAALETAHAAVNQMLTEVAEEKFRDIPLAHPLRVSLLNDALQFYKGLANLDEHRPSLTSDMAKVLHDMAGLQRELGKNDDARRSLSQGIALLSTKKTETLATEEQLANLELDLAYTMESAQSNQMEPSAIEAQYRRALTHFHDLELRSPERRYPYVIALRYLADRAFKRGDLQEAEELWRQSIANGEACLVQRPNDLDTRVSICWTCMQFFDEDLINSSERRGEGEAILKQGLAHVNVALNQKAHSSQARDVAASLNFCLALSYCRSGRVPEATRLFTKAAELIESLCTDFPWDSDYWNTLEWFMSDTAKSLKEHGELEAAQDALRGYVRWIKEARSTAVRDPGPRKFLQQAQTQLVKELRAADLGQEAQGIASAP